jgi:hypothetical protein
MDSAYSGRSRNYLKQMKLFSSLIGDFFLEENRGDFYYEFFGGDNNCQYVYNL